MQTTINLMRTTLASVLLAIALLTGPTPLRAQIMPILKVDGKESNLVYLQRLDVDVRIYGSVATTTWTMTFKNTTSRTLEGELTFPLAEGVSVARYALDINGRLREAVPVEKTRGTMVFENIERRRVDPGLLEKVEGNGFRTRIYPITPSGVRTVLIAYDEELSMGHSPSPGSSSSLRWHLPLSFSHPLDEFNLHVQILRGSIKPVIEDNVDQTFQFDEWEDSWSAQKSWKQFKADRSLTILIPSTPEDHQVTMQPSGNHYLYLLNAFPSSKKIAKPQPRRITLLWDVSLSGLNRDHDKELRLLDSYFDALKNVEVALVPFNHKMGAVKVYTVTEGKWTALRDTLQHMVYDGGTQFGALRPEDYPGDEYLLFSDGQSSFGSDKMPAPKKPLYAIVATAKADLPYLRALTEQSGGELIDLETSAVQEAKTQLMDQSLYFLGVKPDPALEESYPSRPVPVVHGITVAGICYQPSHEVVLQFGYGGKVMSETKVMLDLSRQKTSDLDLTRIWAQKKITQLDKRYDDNKLEIEDLGRRYGIVTRNTSLIVLEAVQDYVTYGIEPPAELREEYDRMIKAQGQVEQHRQQAATENAEKYFDELLAWWKEDHKAPPPPPPAKNFHPDTVTYISPDAAAGNTPVQMLQGRAPGLSVTRNTSPRVRRGEEAPPSANREEMGKGVVTQNVQEEEINSFYANPASPSPPSSGVFRAFDREIQTAYLGRLKKTPLNDQYAVYLRERKTQLYTPLFYFNTAHLFFKEGKNELGLQVLSNIAELDVESYELYKMLGYELRRLGETSAACAAFKKVLEWRPFEPQSFRDYGLALWDAGLYQQALDTLYAALTKNYDTGISALYPGIEETILPEINSLVALKGDKVNFSRIPQRLLTNMPVDLRVVLNWNMNDTDIDLWVTDPYGEKCYYSHRSTFIGGRISNDFTRGFGPEQFILKKALKGRYKVEVNYYGDRQTKLAGPTTVMLEVYMYYGTAKQTRKLIPLQMQSQGDRTVLIGNFDFQQVTGEEGK